MDNRESIMSVKDWLITWLLLMIPFANIAFLFIWAFGSTGNLNRKNFAKSYLILMCIMIVLQITLFIIFWGSMFLLGLASAGSY